MADARGLGPRGVTLAGSSPVSPTNPPERERTCSGSPGTVTPNLLTFTSITLVSRQAVLQWTGNGVLEQVTTVAGPWRTAPNQNNPQAVPVGPGNLFFRLHR
jgi:hypothetical protein